MEECANTSQILFTESHRDVQFVTWRACDGIDILVSSSQTAHMTFILKQRGCFGRRM